MSPASYQLLHPAMLWDCKGKRKLTRSKMFFKFFEEHSLNYPKSTFSFLPECLLRIRFPVGYQRNPKWNRQWQLGFSLRSTLLFREVPFPPTLQHSWPTSVFRNDTPPALLHFGWRNGTLKQSNQRQRSNRQLPSWE